jgi:hypothetical protein
VKTILEFIVDEFRDSGIPLTLDEIARKRGIERSAVDAQMRKADRISDFRGLTPDQAFKVLEFYGPGAIFDNSLERAIMEFQASKARLDEMDRRGGG